mgnify:CR=1 FL=1
MNDVASAYGWPLTDSQRRLAVAHLGGEQQAALECLRKCAVWEDCRCAPSECPHWPLGIQRRNGAFVRALIDAGRVSACHGLSGGGLAVGVAEMAMAGGIGAAIEAPAGTPPLHAWLFGEDQGRYVLAVTDAAAVLADAAKAGVPAAVIGRTGGDALTVNGSLSISLGELKNAHRDWLPTFMAAP